MHVLRLLLSLSVVLGACADPGPPSPALGEAQQAMRNGTRAPQIVTLPVGQQKAIGWLHDPADPGTSFCTGTLVAPRVVVTAAHCLQGRRAETVGFGIGTLPTQPEGVFGVASVQTHPTQDVAVLLLDEDARAQVPDVLPVAINRTRLDPVLLGRMVEVAGFGDTGDFELTGRFFAAVRLVDVDDVFVTVDGEGRQGLCFGDSGGPVLMPDAAGTPLLLGVEHGGDSSCVGRDLLTRLDPLQAWLAEVVGEAAKLSPAVADCSGLGYQGRCNGAVAEWCDDNARVARMDCGAYGRSCGFVDDATGFYCLDPGDACGGVTAQGLCLDGTAQRCVGGVLQADRCGEAGLACVVGEGGAAGASPEALPDRPGGAFPTGGAPAGATAQAGSHLEGGCHAAPDGAPATGLLLLLGLGLRRRRPRASRTMSWTSS